MNFQLAFVCFAAASLLITLALICFCALDTRHSSLSADLKAQEDFYNPFRQDKKLTFRTFPQIILRDRPQADLTIVHTITSASRARA